MEEKQKINVVLCKVEDLIPYVNNARIHSDEQVCQIAASIREFGFNSPIITDGESGVLAGHGRLLAAKKLGLSTVPTIQVGHLSKAQQKAFILADNKIGDNSGFDFELVSLEIQSLQEIDFDINLTGFSSFELGVIEAGSSDGGEGYDGGGENGGGEGYEGGGENGGDEQGYTIQYTIIFDDEQQQKAWHSHIKSLKAKYPDMESIAQRLIAEIQK